MKTDNPNINNINSIEIEKQEFNLHSEMTKQVLITYAGMLEVQLITYIHVFSIDIH